MNKKPLILLLPIILSACAATDTVASRKVFGCDTMFLIEAYNVKEEKLRPLEDLVLKFSKLFDGFQTYRNTINIATINQTNEELILSKDLYQALKVADNFYKETEGYFNPYMGNLTYEYKNSYLENKLPLKSKIDDALADLKSFKMEFNDERSSVKRIGNATIDLGAFGKGYILDLIKDLAKEKNIKNYLVSGGTSSTYFTSKPGNKSYKAGISYLPNKYLDMKDKSLGISAIFEQYIELDGVKYSHIISPFTGLPSMKYDFSAVIHESATVTDVYSTALMVADSNDTLKKLIDKQNIECFVYKNDKCVYKTDNIKLKSY